MPPIRRAAIFDLDGTVIDCSSEKKFAAHLIEKGVVRFKDFARWFAHMLADLPRDPARALKANRSYLRGKPIDLLRDAAAQFIEAEMKARIAADAYEAVNKRRADGDLILILSGSLDMLVAPIAAHLGADGYRASVLETADGIATGRLAALHPMGRHKATIAEEMAAQYGFRLSEATAYADRRSDAALLKRVQTPIAVTPKRRLRWFASRAGWEIADWHR